MLTPGQRLRALREEFGLTIRKVEIATLRIAAKHNQEDFAIPLGRLSDIEAKGMVPSIFRLYSLSVVYRRDMREFMAWYGVDLDQAAADLNSAEPPKSNRPEVRATPTRPAAPLPLSPSDTRKTLNLRRMTEPWGGLPLAYLSEFVKTEFTYGYVEDFTMYPILVPGSFLQIDESKKHVVNGVWRSEYERPIYFVQTREGYSCSWCAVKNDYLILQSHPLSPVPVRVLAYPYDAEVVGQVVGMATKFGDWRPCQPGQYGDMVPDSTDVAGGGPCAPADTSSIGKKN